MYSFRCELRLYGCVCGCVFGSYSFFFAVLNCSFYRAAIFVVVTADLFELRNEIILDRVDGAQSITFNVLEALRLGKIFKEIRCSKRPFL